MVEENSAGGVPIQSSIIVPAYNEEDALPSVLARIIDAVNETYEIIVVDDGSCDRTKEIASALACRVVCHAANQGKGAAMRSGLGAATGQKVIFIDADGTYPAEAIPQVAAALDEYDVVRCVRSNGRDNIPLLNRLGNTIFDHTLSALYSMEGTDFLTGLYGVRRRHLLAMQLESSGFDIESEIAIKARAMGLRGVQIPIEYHARLGEKKLQPLRDGSRILARIMILTVTHNPVRVFVVPGLIMLLLALVSILVLTVGEVRTSSFVPSINSVIVSAMALLTGFQLVVFGYAATLYAVAHGFAAASSRLVRLVDKFPPLAGVLVGFTLMVIGLAWSAVLVIRWVTGGFGPFGVGNSEMLVVALALMVCGVQMLSIVLFLSLTRSQSKHSSPVALRNQ